MAAGLVVGGVAGHSVQVTAVLPSCALRSLRFPGLVAGAEAHLSGDKGAAKVRHPLLLNDAPHAEKRLTPEQGKALLRSVDEVLGFVSGDTGLKVEHPVKRRLISRAEVGRFLRVKFDEDEGAKRMERSELVLKKFGMLDRDFHLRPFLLSLLTEQIAGFYDNKTKTVNLLDWVAVEEQKPVLAHELTHALQDQRVDLQHWADVGQHDQARTAADDTRHIQTDEGDTAREAVAEGQAMVSFVDYALKPSGKTLADSPEMLDKFKGAAGDTTGSPVMARAPLVLQQSLLFPYSEGLSFEEAVLRKRGRAGAFAGALERPPSSSAEILHPAAYLTGAPVPVLRLPDLHPLLDTEYAPYDVGVMGELDVRMLTELFAAKEVAEVLAPAWDGGVYYAGQRRSVADKAGTGSLALVYVSRWKTEEAAQAFLRVYAGSLGRKYSGVVERKKDEADGEEQVYTTNEGDVVISVVGKTVYVGEGLSVELSRQVRDRVLGAQGSGPVMVASELGMEVGRWVGGFGMMRAGYTLGWSGAHLGDDEAAAKVGHPSTR